MNQESKKREERKKETANGIFSFVYRCRKYFLCSMKSRRPWNLVPGPSPQGTHQ
jgi:hypothetical protein